MEYCQILYKVIQGDLLRDSLAMINCWYLCKSAWNIEMHSVGEIQTMGEEGGGGEGCL